MLITAEAQAAQAIVEPLRRAGLEVTVTGDLATALARINEHQLVILDAADESALALACRRIIDESGSRHPPLLAVIHGRDVESRVRLLEAGADDVLTQPVDERELEALVEALMLRAPAVPTDTASVDGAVAARPAPTAPGRLVAFAAAKGGSGTTTLAVNTALVLAEGPGSVAIADFDMYHGQVSTHLDIYARTSTAEIAREERAAQTPDAIHEMGKQHSSGLTVFGGPYRTDEGADISADQLRSLAGLMRTSYSMVIIDAGSVPDVRSLGVLASADQIVMPITPDIPSLRLLHAELQVMSEAGAVADKTIFVLNHIYPKPMISAEQIEEHLGVRIGLEVPYDGETFIRAVNEGHPMMMLGRRTPAAVAVKRLAEMLVETRTEETRSTSETPARKNLLRSILSRN